MKTVHLKHLVGLSVLLWSGVAQAYRPFDGTDADVAEKGKYELELGPGYVSQRGGRTAVAPWMINNLGIAQGHELVLEAHHFLRIGDGDVPRSRIGDNGFFLKSVVRRGSLQDLTGPSVATEIGVLLPEYHDNPHPGASFGTIFSQRFAAFAAHLNVVSVFTRTREYNLFTGLIMEGPALWPVRPVAELFLQRTFGGGPAFSEGLTRSVLVGAIAPIDEGVVLDAGMRVARGPEGDVFELRIGLTLSMQVFGGDVEAVPVEVHHHHPRTEAHPPPGPR